MAVLRWTETAVNELEEILEFMSREFPGFDRIFANGIMGFLKEQILPHPWAGRIVDEYEDERLRQRIFKRYRRACELTPVNSV